MSKSPPSLSGARVWTGALVLILALLVVSTRPARADEPDETIDKVTQLNKDAVVAIQAKKWEDARKILKQALDLASANGLEAHPIKARTHIHLGIVIINGFNQRDLGIKQFRKALEIAPEINLTKVLVTPDLSDAFAEAKAQAKADGKGEDKTEDAAEDKTDGKTDAKTDAKKATPAAAPPADSGKAAPAPSPAAAAAPAAAAPTESKPEAASTPAAAPATTPPAAATPPAAEGASGDEQVSSNGLTHEAVAEGKQGSAISITVQVQSDLQFEKLVLAYRPDGASEFLGRQMKQVADGTYGAEIPTTATLGSTVAYYIEAQDADGGPVSARGSVDNPLVIHLSGVGAVHRRVEEEEEEQEDQDEGPTRRYFVGIMAGPGFGWASGNGDTNHDVAINPGGVALAGVGQVAPEFGYWWSSRLLLSVQMRYEIVTGTTPIYCGGDNTSGSCSNNPNGVYHTANYALALFARATWKFGEGSFHPFFSLAAGGGSIRHTVSYQNTPAAWNCGPNHNQVCVDTIAAGPVLLGPGAGLLYDIGDRAALIGQLNSTLGFPTFTVNLDVNVGVAFGF